MLHLRSNSRQRWLDQVTRDLSEILIDHAHCERKAASTALGLMNSYVRNHVLAREMTRIVHDELDHYEQVLILLESRGIVFQEQRPGTYGKKLHELIRTFEPQRAVDRLLVAALIEARSCERFELLSQHVDDQELVRFYESLFESEARHHATYVRLAEHFASRTEVRERLDELAIAEAAIIDQGCELPRMHS
jgi:tRNA-(ms[2]io[6]A)-hydroxylase